jgi:hypothetical protein
LGRAYTRVRRELLRTSAYAASCSHPPCLCPCPSSPRCRAGKSCLVDTAVRKGFGVVHVSVPAGESLSDIVKAVYMATTRTWTPYNFNLAPSAGRVLFFHRLLFRKPIVVVLHAAERRNGQQYADLPAACRQLVAFGYRVIVDASHGSLDPGTVATLREREFTVEPMSRSLVEQLTGLGPLHAALAEAGLSDVVWEVLGGYPAAYEQLNTAWAEAGDHSSPIKATAERFVALKLGDAIDLRDSAEPVYRSLFERFRAVDAVPAAELNALGTSRHSPDQVLRKVRGPGSTHVLVPASPAMAVVLRHGLARVPPLAVLTAEVAGGGARVTV